MSWTNLFKSKKTAQDPRVRWFGKLPTYADYYSSKADESWAIELNDWILKGYELLRSRQSAHQTSRRVLPFGAGALRLAKSEMTVFASIMDYGGDQRGRPFPMCFYVGVPSAQWPGPTSDRLVSAARLIRDLLDLRREVARFLNSPGHFETVFGGRVLDLSGIDDQTTDNSWQEQAKRIRINDWFQGARDNLRINEPRTWLRAVTRWGDSVAALESKSFEPTLRMPLAREVVHGDAALDVQLAGWIYWLESRLHLRRRNYSFLLTGTCDDCSPNLSIVARDLLPDDFLLFSDLAHTLPYLDDVSRLEAELATETDQAVNDRVEPDGSWMDFVRTPPAPA
jgi:hypothetical protein